MFEIKKSSTGVVAYMPCKCQEIEFAFEKNVDKKLKNQIRLVFVVEMIEKLKF